MNVISEYLYYAHFFLPIPFMIFYSVKTKKLNRFTYLFAVLPIISTVILILLQIPVGYVGFKLMMYYSCMLGLGTLIFRRKYDLPQALSLAFNLAFFNSLYWEIPTHLYTIFYFKFIDTTFGLLLIYAFPAFFLYSKVRFPNPHRKQYSLFLLGLAFSTLCLGIRVTQDPYIWGKISSLLVEGVSDVNRFVCFAVLIKIFYITSPIIKGERNIKR